MAVAKNIIPSAEEPGSVNPLPGKFYAARDIPENVVLQPEDITEIPPVAKWSGWIKEDDNQAPDFEKQRMKEGLQGNPELQFSMIGSTLMFQFVPEPGQVGEREIMECLILRRMVLIDHAAEGKADAEA